MMREAGAVSTASAIDAPRHLQLQVVQMAQSTVRC
jgi:hypothetical protein